MSTAPTAEGGVRHALLVVGSYTLLFAWLFGMPILEGSLLAESDMYEQFLPVFLSPFTIWSSYEFGGMPAFADPQDTAFYPVHVVFARLLGSWTGYILSAFVLVSCFTYAYVFALTRSKTAAALAGLAFGFSEAMIERLAHVTTLHAIAWLPLMLLCIDRIRERRSAGWVALGAFAVGSCILGGHSQVVLYLMYACGAYALAGGLMERAPIAAWGRLAGALALGVALTAIKAVPLAETAQMTARQALGLAGFVSHSNTPAQMLSALFPAVEHEGREAPTYVGMATLLFALVAALRPVRHWRVAFWMAVIAVAGLIGMGDATPVAQVAYDLPLYDRFRVGARHLILACFGLCVLAGYGVAAVTAAAADSRRLVGWAAACLLVLVAAGGAALVSSPDAFHVSDPQAAIRTQLMLFAASFAACVGLARPPHRTVWALALAATLGADLLLAQPHPVTRAGLDWPRIPREAASAPSVHAERLAAAMRPRGQRLLAPAGTQLDTVVPGAFARVWQIPIAGGYGPMLLARHNALAMMGTNGSVDLLTLADDNTALDVLGVRFVVLSEADLASSPTFDEDGVRWASRPIGVTVGPRECGQRHPRTTSYALPADVDVVSVALVARLRCSEDVPQGSEVARLHLTGESESVYERTLLAGVDIAEGMLADPAILARSKHQPARVFGNGAPGAEPWSYLVRMDLPSPIRTGTLRVDVTGTAGWLDIEHLTAIDADGTAVPVELPGFLLARDRWRETTRVATSRVTDRGRDEDDPRESRAVVFENQRALPRAWVASEVVPLDDKAMDTAVHHSLLPDGRRFDPARVALVPSGTRDGTRYPDGASTVVVRSIDDGAFTVDVATDGGGFLVLGESYYPGWQARIDNGDPMPVQVANVSLQGVDVPPGVHRVRFELISQTLRTGAAISALAAGLLLACAAYGAARSRRHASRHSSWSNTSGP